MAALHGRLLETQAGCYFRSTASGGVSEKVPWRRQLIVEGQSASSTESELKPAIQF